MAGDESEKTYSAKQVAHRIGTDPKQLRKFFRDPKSGYDAVGQGGRYDFPESEIPKIRDAFNAWSSGKTTRTRARTQPTSTPKTASGMIPGQRKQSPARPANPMDGDDLRMRMTGIKARMEHHGLTMKGGRFVPRDEPKKSPQTILTNKEAQDFAEWSDENIQGPTDEQIIALLEEIGGE